jgi:uncharacterized protein YeaO (DUF488 family)
VADATSPRVWTATLRYGGEDRLDITRGSGYGLGLEFAPSPGLFAEYLANRRRGAFDREAQAYYLRRYRAEVEATRRARPALWRALCDRRATTLCCYCENPSACHRGALAKMLTTDGVVYEGERPMRIGDW